uniref:Large ribosomal subunit protein mL42 n=1 Tax=Oryctolagus cuniculus TaxID=9986 RepID=A0A5F9DEV6_RABIT
TGNIKENYLETFISTPKWSFILTIVRYHPSVDIPYEHTKPIPRPDPVLNNEEIHDQVLKTRLEEKSEHLEQGPMIEQLSKMFFTTKHRWYPCGHDHICRKKLDPPRGK